MDPLNINYLQQTRLLLQSIPVDIAQENGFLLREIQRASLPHAIQLPALLQCLSQALAIPALTLLVARAFRPILLDLAARWLDSDGLDLARFYALAFLLDAHEELYPVLTRLLGTPSMSNGPLTLYMSLSDWNVAGMPPEELHSVLLSYYRVVLVDSSLPDRFGWPLRPLRLLFTEHHDAGVRLLAVRCYAIQAEMSEAERNKLDARCVGDGAKVDAPIYLGGVIDGDPRAIKSPVADGWSLPLFEIDRIDSIRRTFSNNRHFYEWREADKAVMPALTDSHISPRIACVCGVLLLRPAGNPLPGLQPSTSHFVLTPTVRSVLRPLALHVSQRLPCLLTSSPSSGKTALVSYLASLLYSSTSPLVSIHLADASLDARSLLGSYISSPTSPGVFHWVEGALVGAMRLGKWLVLEDIDRANQDVLTTILPLLESMGPTKGIGARPFIDIPGRGRVEAADGFLILATRSVVLRRSSHNEPGPSNPFPRPVFFGHQHMSELILPAPDLTELSVILESMFQRLDSSMTELLISVWMAVREARSVAFQRQGREVGLLELFKFGRRVANLMSSTSCPTTSDKGSTNVTYSTLSPAIKEEILLEALDIFAGHLQEGEHGIHHAIGHSMAISIERVQWIISQRTPELILRDDRSGPTVTSGRVTLKRQTTMQHSDSVTTPPRPFALHRPSQKLLEQLAVATQVNEPILLVGETGTGKTSAVQHLASLLGHSLTVLNLSTQTETADIIGGLKPMDPRISATQLQEQFLELFGRSFSRKRNAAFVDAVRKAFLTGRWSRLAGLWRESARLARERRSAELAGTSSSLPMRASKPEVSPRKRRKIEGFSPHDDRSSPSDPWEAFEEAVGVFEAQHVDARARFNFSFVEGPLVTALRYGNWVLLDEINLASAEVLESILSVLEGSQGSLTLTEKGDLTPVPRHASFRLFSCMNPATDVGKKDLPPRVRSRFTEIFVPPPDSEKNALLAIIHQYIGHCALGDRAALLDVAEYYTAVRRLEKSQQLSDGLNRTPHYNMRTLVRALSYAAQFSSAFGLRRALWEGSLMCFTMTLDAHSTSLVLREAKLYLLARTKNPQSLLALIPAVPSGEYADQFAPFFIEKGPMPIPDLEGEYILTPSVNKKLLDLARIIGAGQLPVLIEGPTSSGKTSSVQYLAHLTGHRFVRINNHEHTDIQEYLGSYVSDPESNKLVYQDGLLVRALRNGDWIVLDELNLAPTDVLEALNRLLDDNRELVIPETQETIRPHPHFMLFATQNPSGLYGGRKPLSRAFRNRFVELHFDDVPQNELETILWKRSRIAPSYAQRIVAVFTELRRRRQANRVFEMKEGFATLRDLFRWAGRKADSVQRLAEDGYMLLAERARRQDDRQIVQDVIQDVLKVTLDISFLYKDVPLNVASGAASLVWTSAMRRLALLMTAALSHNEPVLLVGETGTGKTSICHVIADALGLQLYSVNCHLNTESADILGGLRPVRHRSHRREDLVSAAHGILNAADLHNPVTPAITEGNVERALDLIIASDETSSELAESLKRVRRDLRAGDPLIEWRDGPLVEAMQFGGLFLLDEISLADDSVLERLNSVLEPSRTLILAEKGGRDLDEVHLLADRKFQFVATMNPGGDYGKKELSPALRNRFTEIFVPSVDSSTDHQMIVESRWSHEDLHAYTAPLLAFFNWLGSRFAERTTFGLRDILAWIYFTNTMHACVPRLLSLGALFHHAAHMTVVDGLGAVFDISGPSSESLHLLEEECKTKLRELVPLSADDEATFQSVLQDSLGHVSIGPFGIVKGEVRSHMADFTLKALTTRENAMRIFRACQLTKPILLEGSPGVGKTSLISAIADASGHRLCRINLSDQTDLSDLFGSDLPVEGGLPGEFAWKDAAFLRAMEVGDWVLLDEMNLAPQPVLEGLNAVLDHRGSVYLPELGRSFTRHPDFRVFAAQNPRQQGGGRKGLPKSFINRFTKVFVRGLTSDDYMTICRHLHPGYPEDMLVQMINFNSSLNFDVNVKHNFGREGAPWEFNLRDILRWLSLMSSFGDKHLSQEPQHSLDLAYISRFRTLSDRRYACDKFSRFFPQSQPDLSNPSFTITPEFVQFGHTVLSRSQRSQSNAPLAIRQAHLRALQTAGKCLELGWPLILTGGSGCGKTALIRLLALITGAQLAEFSMSSATDTSDLLGTFEQANPEQQLAAVLRHTIEEIERCARAASGVLLHVDEQKDLISGLMRQHDHTPLTGPRRAEAISACSKALIWMDHLNLGSPSMSSALRQELANLPISDEAKGRFEWVDGPFVQAMKEGCWLLIDNANLCNASVLDRLNSVLETEGVLVLNERGMVEDQVQIVRPHPSFRVIMAVDPAHGELSRAMRNRGVEVSLSGFFTGDVDLSRLRHILRMPSEAAGSSLGLTAAVLENKLSRLSLADDLRYDGHSASATLAAAWGSLLLRDSAIANQVVPLTTSFMSDSLNNPFMAEAAALFVIQASRLEAAPFFIRLLQNPPSFSRLDRLPYLHRLLHDVPPKINQLVSSTRTLIAARLGLPEPLVSDQPTDPELNPFVNVFHLVPSQVSRSQADALALLTRWTFCRPSDTGAAASEINGAIEPWRDTALSSTLYNQLLAHLSSLIDLSCATTDIVLRRVLDNQDNEDIEVLLEGSRDLIDCASRLHDLAGRRHLDFSVLDLLTRWLCNTRLCSQSLYKDVLQKAVAIRGLLVAPSGLGMLQIWRAFLHADWTTTVPPLLKEIDTASNQLSMSSNFIYAREKAWNLLLSSIRIDNTSGVDLHTTSAGEKLLQELRVLPSSLWHEPSRSDARSILIAGLEVLATPEDPSNDPTIGAIDTVTTLAVQSPGYPLLPSIAWHLAGQVQRGVTTKAAVLSPHRLFAWLESGWSYGRLSEGADGPAGIFGPVNLLRTLQLLSFESRSLSSLSAFEASLRRHATFSAALGSVTLLGRCDQVFRALLYFVQNLCLCFESSYPPDILARISDLHVVDGFKRNSALQSWLHDLSLSSSEFLAKVVERRLSPVLLRFGLSQSSPVDDILNAGKAWVAVSQALLELYWPEVPIDPLTSLKCEIGLWTERRSRILAQMAFHSLSDSIMTGNETSVKLTSLAHSLAHVQEVLDGLQEPPSARNTELTTLHSLFTELRQFYAQVIDERRISALTEALAHGGDEAAFHAEGMVQKSVNAFVSRLRQGYSQLYDITFPLLVALRQLQLGLNMIARAGELNRERSKIGEEHLNILPVLLQFPTVAVTRALLLDVFPSYAGFHRLPTSRLLLHLCVAARHTLLSGSLDLHADKVEAIYGTLYDRWAKERDLESTKSAADQSLYRTRGQNFDARSDEEAEELDFQKMFPEYKDPFDMDNQEDRPPLSLGMTVTTEASQLLHDIHCLLVEGVEDDTYNIDVHLSKLRIDEINNLQLLAYTDTIDTQSLPFTLTSMDSVLSRIGTTDSRAQSFNFYKHADVTEIRKAVKLLQDLIRKVDALLEQYPDQAQLGHVQERCRAVLQFKLDVPIVRVLSALEVLLGHIESWESFANRENSLKGHRDAITSLIVEWRRMELQCWAGLLESEANAFSAAPGWWFLLYETVIRPSLSDKFEQEDMQQYVRQLVSVLEDFFASSSLGQFHARLRLAQSFSRYLSALVPSATRSHLSRWTCRILDGLTTYYTQFANAIQAAIRSQKVHVDQEIRDFIRLASWKDVNINALRQSALKTHRQLHKAVRKFRDILRQPASPLLSFPLEEALDNTAQITTPDIDTPQYSCGSIPLGTTPGLGNAPTLDLSVALRRLQAMRQLSLRGFVGFDASTAVERLAISIITDLNSFAQETLEVSHASKVKALVARKRKAWSDTLKELKSDGLSARLPPSALAQQADRSWLFGLATPLLEMGDLPDLYPLIKKTDAYYARLCECMPLMRQGLRTPNTDVPVRDLQRAAGLVESAFSLGLNARQLAGRVCCSYGFWTRTLKRLQVPTSEEFSGHVVACGPNSERLFKSALIMARQLINSLKEVADGVIRFSRYRETETPTRTALTSIHEALTKQRAVADELERLHSRIRMTDPPLLLTDEQHALRNATESFQDALVMLRTLSLAQSELRYLLQPTAEWLENEIAECLYSGSTVVTDAPDDLPETLCDKLISGVLVVSQGLHKAAVAADGSESSTDLHLQIQQFSDRTLLIAQLLHMDEIVQQFKDLMMAFESNCLPAQGNDARVIRMLRRALPFLCEYFDLLSLAATNLLRWNKAMFKLTHVLCTAVRTVAFKGFCKPKDMDDTEAKGDLASETVEGTGIGEGLGRENASNEVQDESQVEGSRGEDQQGDNDKKEDAEPADDAAVEMADDFAGRLEDMPVSDADESVQSDSDSEDISAEDQIGKVDPLDPDALDEKLWGDTEAPGSTPEPLTNANPKGKQEANSSEMGTKHDTDERSKRHDMNPLDEPPIKDFTPELDGSVDDEETMPENDQSGPLEDNVVNSDILDLPEDLNLGEDPESQDLVSEASVGDSGVDGQMSDFAEREDVPEDGDRGLEELEEGTAAPDNMASVQEAADVQGEELNQDNIGGVEDQDMDGTSRQPLDSCDPTTQTPGNSDNISSMEHHEKQAEQSSRGQGKDGTNRGTSPNVSAEDMPTVSEDMGTHGETDAPPEQEQSEHNDSSDSRLFGDPTKLTYRPSDHIRRAHGDGAPPTDRLAEAPPPSLEYLQEDSVDDSELQALGPGQDGQVAPASQLNILDSETQDEDLSMDWEPTETIPHVAEQVHMESLLDPTVERALTGEQVLMAHGPDATRTDVQPGIGDANENFPIEQDPEATMRMWREHDQPSSDAASLWHMYTAMTQELAYGLCEQLRLILEPTVATRLKGDYRTGKRLNMKKIIPYIASDFTKDKIWLRRTKPSRREYQVLIALDDSRSMAESHSVHLAFQTLALVSNALSKLEVGDVAIVGFGESVEVLHDFGTGDVTDAVGAKIMSRLKFSQIGTDVHALLERSLSVLADARERHGHLSSTAGDLWQLEIILSDGVCQSHERLRGLLRRADEQKVMVVFIILDSLRLSSKGGADPFSAQGSILSMKQASYEEVNGQMEVQMKRYMDTFPFDYYIILRDVNALPDVLSATLRQFFEIR